MITCQFENGDNVNLRHITLNAIVLRGNQVLLGLRGTFRGKSILESGKWALLGGFMDRDETLIDAIKREVMEESGWDIRDVTLFRINDNPNRPKEDRQNVDFAYIAHAVKQISEPNQETKDLQWFDLNKLPPPDQFAFDHRDNLELYLQHLQKPFNLPIFGNITP